MILTCNGTALPPKNGEAIKNAPIRKLAKNKPARSSITNCKLTPGKGPTPAIFDSVKSSIRLSYLSNLFKNIIKIIC